MTDTYYESRDKSTNSQYEQWNFSVIFTVTPHHSHLIPARHSLDQQVFLHTAHFELVGRLPSRQWCWCLTDIGDWKFTKNFSWKSSFSFSFSFLHYLVLVHRSLFHGNHWQRNLCNLHVHNIRKLNQTNNLYFFENKIKWAHIWNKRKRVSVNMCVLVNLIRAWFCFTLDEKR